MDGIHVTQLLLEINEGSSDANAKLYALLYTDIKRLARSRLYAAGHAHSLNTTGLVNEGFLRIADRENMTSGSRAQFFAYVGKVFRSVVLDHIRSEQAQKRGGDFEQVTLSHAEGVAAPGTESSSDLFSLDAALEHLREVDDTLYELVELRYFAGLTVDEIASLRKVTSRTVNRDWVKAKMLLEEIMSSDHKTAADKQSLH
jgi:RNA polymerase sigma factor (TIGR02999 family)